jgi:antitoxin (DNA-binding transcriptional repressor) of toxin-antitoxin stability system
LENAGMKASIVDLRKKSAEVLRAIERNECVTVYYRGRAKAVLRPLQAPADGIPAPVRRHRAFGLWADRGDLVNPAKHVRGLRKGRFAALGDSPA